MTRFVDKYLGARIQGYPVDVVPMFSTQIVVLASGAEQVNQQWQDPKRNITIPQGVRDMATFNALRDHWLVMAGPARTWPWRDPSDFATVALADMNLSPTTARSDQLFGIGDGITTQFQLYKSYAVGSPATPYQRIIQFPIVASVQIGVNGLDPSVFSPHSTWTVTRAGGIVTFSSAPPVGALLTWGGLFDLQVRFEADDTFNAIMQTYRVAGFADIPLKEVPYCED